MGFSKNQIRVFDVLKTPSQNILVNAGAGSGKTTVLKKRVTNLLINGREAIGETITQNGKEIKGFHIDEIMVLTFTNEAAKSMKDKIIESINEAIRNGHEELKEELSRIDEAIISTFDSYFSKFVKKYSSYSKIPSNFQTGDTSLFKMKETEIVENIFNEHFAKGYNSKSLNEFDEFINIYGSKLKKNKAIEQVVSCYQAIQKEIDVNKYLNDYFKH